MIVSNRLGGVDRRPVSCMILDGVYSFAFDLEEERGIPVIYMRTTSACSFWAYFCLPQLIESGECPFNGSNMDVLIKSVPGMEGFLRRRDLPGICRMTDMTDPDLQFFINETQQSTRARGLILNTFEDLEGPILSQIRKKIPNIYTIGPLHELLNLRLNNQRASPPLASSTSFLQEDRSCLAWLDLQPLQSVVYVSFGSFTVTTKNQMMEFWHGLVNSGRRFLWAIRPDIVTSNEEGDWKSQIPSELEKGTEERGYMVEWAPQKEVLAHQAVGGFLTHSGWNSTLESISLGKPMICWPYFADQQINSRFVGEVWKVGLDMKDTCDRFIVEAMINDLMEVKKNELVESANRMVELAKNAIGDGGSSFNNLDRLIQDIRSICSQSLTVMRNQII